MKLVIFGLTVSSSWANGHATLWRGLIASLAKRGHRVVFFERDTKYYAAHRDYREVPHGALILYSDWNEARVLAQRELSDADAAFVTSFCPDGVAATEEVLASRAKSVFYDLDTPVTLQKLRDGEDIAYIGPRGLRDFDLVLSFTGGDSLRQLQTAFGARQVAPLYGSVDPGTHKPVPVNPDWACDLSYLGTYAEDRQAQLDALFFDAARQSPQRRFVLGGSQYPDTNFPPNIIYAWHVAPHSHPEFYCSGRLTLNITRRAMAEIGYCPSGRLFEAAACGVPILSDNWPGLDTFFAPKEEILLAQTTQNALQALERDDAELQRIARQARERVLAEHTSDQRAQELEALLSISPS